MEWKKLGRTGVRSAWFACLVAVTLSQSPPATALPVFSAGEFRLLPLRLHLLRSPASPALNCRLQEQDARRILGKINGIWRAAGIQFYAESILIEEAANQGLYEAFGANRTEAHLRLVRPRSTQTGQTFHLYFIGEMRPNGISLESSHELLFVKESARLNPVPGGIDEPLPRVSAHEIGHALGLPHHPDRWHLMASGTTGTYLSAEEAELARKTASLWSWCLTPGDALSAAERSESEGRLLLARAIYSALTHLPGGDIVRTARERLKGSR